MVDLTPLGMAAIALLLERPMHPYEMYQTLLHRREDRNIKVRPGSLYHAIDRLAEQGLVEQLSTEREGNRPERTTYAVTDAGRSALLDHVRAMLRTPAREYPEFPLAVSEAHNLPAATVVALLGERRAALVEELDDLRMGLEAVRSTALPRRFTLDVSYKIAILAADLDWLETAITDIGSGHISWTEPVPPQPKVNS
ncbi:PadR family transcriptional regulator [Rathayibacter sp. YIM 133350]|uniref:PadR family transcriptional regulator n=1 Tax=Rathayibacter sp. YIM 133350 TaxID=3131992 RepID=UPI00307ECCD9